MTLAAKQRPHYTNCLMVSRDGTPLATLSTKRANWYLSRNLARLIDWPDKRFHPVIQLTFQHAGDGSVNAVDLEFVENRCVVCGSTTGLTTHHCIPRRVKSHYPARLKDRLRRQTCVLVCDAHHAAAEVESAKVPDGSLAYKALPRWVKRLVSPKTHLAVWSLRHGGFKRLNRLYVEAFLRLKPRFLPRGWLDLSDFS